MPLSLKETDARFMKIQHTIDAKKKMLYNKQKTLKSVAKQNAFLETVKQDYKKYQDYIIAQKKSQMHALSMLDGYIRDLTHSGKLSKQNVEDATCEQTKILKEVSSIQKSLDDIINEI